MKRITFIVVSVLLLALSGCSQKDMEKQYKYTGENENWSVEYKVTSTDSTAERSFVANYKGDISQLEKAKHLEISYESTAGGGKLTRDFNGNPPDKKTYTLTSITEGGAMESRDETIYVTIEIDGKAEKLELKVLK
jgi:murein tripeptide amidase MpaA